VETYKGIAYSIQSVGNDQWRWMIRPPLSVRGLRPLDGTFVGRSNKVVELVKAEIDMQVELDPRVSPSRSA